MNKFSNIFKESAAEDVSPKHPQFIFSPLNIAVIIARVKPNISIRIRKRFSLRFIFINKKMPKRNSSQDRIIAKILTRNVGRILKFATESEKATGSIIFWYPEKTKSPPNAVERRAKKILLR